MKNYIRFLALFLIIMIMVSGVFTASANSVDNEAPVIHSITIANHTAGKTYGPNDKLKVQVSVTDNISIGAIWVYIKNAETGEELIRDLQQPSVTDKYTLEFSFESCVSGKYYIRCVSVSDSAYNYTIENFSEEDSYYCFSVNNPTYKPGVPNVKSLKVTPDKGHSTKTQFTYTAVIEPTGKEKITRVAIDVGQKLGEQSSVSNCMDLEPTGKKNEYSATVTFRDRFSSPIKYPEVFKMDVNTEDGRFYCFYPEDTTIEWAEYFLPGITRKDLTINFTDITEDKEPPKLVGYRYSCTEVYTPDYLKVIVDATDDSGEAGVFDIFFGKEGDPSFLGDVQYSGADSNTEIYYKFPRYCGNGTYYVKKIILRDAYGNTSTYLLENGDFEKKTFTVYDVTEADYYTSITSSDFLDVITKASEEKGKTVVINISENNPTIPKAVFEIIAGKDVTVIFEKMYDYSSSGGESDDGIEWVMYGKHVDKSKAKDINAYIKIKEEDWRSEAIQKQFKKPSREKGNTFIRIIFANNGELPGKATIRFKPGFTLKGFTNTNDMRLYYLNDTTSEVDLVASNIKAEKTGYFHFNITHNSSYAFVGDYKEESSGGGGNGGSGNGGSGNGETAENPDGDTAPEDDANSETAESGEAATNTIGALNTEENTEKGGNALTVVIIVLGALALIGGGVFGYFYYKNLKGKKDDKTE